MAINDRSWSLIVDAENTYMYQEAQASSTLVALQLQQNQSCIETIVNTIQKKGISQVVTCARGSSAHAATYAKYLFETGLGLLTTPLALSVNTCYEKKINYTHTLFLVVSQSGESPDLLEGIKAARQSGALIVALLNNVDSSVAAVSDYVIPLHAGIEKSVAATKSFILTLTAIVHLSAVWLKSDTLMKQLNALSGDLSRAWQLDWSNAEKSLQSAHNLFVIGRGYGLSIAYEAALKFKETGGIHAEAFSSAEVKHGPMTLIKAGFPVLFFSQKDETQADMMTLVDNLIDRQSQLLVVGAGTQKPWRLPIVEGVSPVLEPILFIQRFYKLANAVSVAKGYDPDNPPYLTKITKTL